MRKEGNDKKNVFANDFEVKHYLEIFLVSWFLGLFNKTERYETNFLKIKVHPNEDPVVLLVSIM